MCNENLIASKVVDLLIQKGWHIAFAESCTGGLCCGALVDVPDASKVLDMSFVTYADFAKERLIGVSADTIAKRGVVSEEVAYEMAIGAAKTAQCEVGVGITGIAGPTGATKNKPVGMVCFGFNISGKVFTFTQYFGEIGRNNVRRKSVEFVYEKLSELILNS